MGLAFRLACSSGFPMFMEGYNIKSSLVASRADHDAMLRFAAHNGINPVVEKFEMSELGNVANVFLRQRHQCVPSSPLPTPSVGLAAASREVLRERPLEDLRDFRIELDAARRQLELGRKRGAHRRRFVEGWRR